MKTNSLLGEKIKRRRRELAITQKALAGDKITRNMLSLIENGSAMPSYETAVYLADALALPLPYLFSADFDLFFYEKTAKIEKIRKSFSENKYQACMKELDLLSGHDDETELMYAVCAFEHAKYLLYQGSLISASKYLTIAKDKCKSTVYDTKNIQCFIPLYDAVINNIGAPLLEFDEKAFSEQYSISEDYEFYKYILQDVEYRFENPVFAKHIKARGLIRKKQYYEAIPQLLEIEETKSGKNCNTVVLFGVYSDLENCYKQIRDFENAYRYSSKLMSLMTGFKI